MSPEDDRRPHFETSIEGVAGRWPEVPDRYSYSSLAEIEACPRRWALSRASFPSVWDGPGYPESISPVFGALGGLPPLLIEVGTAEILLDDARRIARKARDAGVQVTLHEEEDAIHVWHFFWLFDPIRGSGVSW